MSLGVYALGALERDEAAAVEAHLAECDACRAEYDEFAGVTVFLGKASEEDVLQAASPPQVVLDRLLNAKAKRRHRTKIMFAIAASAAVVVAGGAVVSEITTTSDSGSTTASAPERANQKADQPKTLMDEGYSEQRALPSPKPSRSESAVTSRAEPDLKASESVPGKARARVELTAGDNGSSVTIALSGVRTGTRCSLVVVGNDGTRDTAASWLVSAAQYGKTSYTQGSTSMAPDQVAKFEIVTADGKLLLTIPVKR
ncbi:zf-HC2 domain-containing protein [Streptosporangium sp. KLBMP 9127]|nr:zf-HC2 domain-containing protein [Streptosporangium sp. KLBMP 9127]